MKALKILIGFRSTRLINATSKKITLHIVIIHKKDPRKQSKRLHANFSGLNSASKGSHSINRGMHDHLMKVSGTNTKLLVLDNVDGEASPIEINFPVITLDQLGGKKLMLLPLSGINICSDIDSTNKTIGFIILSAKGSKKFSNNIYAHELVT